jgi:putative transposase
MKDRQSQTYVKWDCKYHVVIVSKYRQRLFFGKQRQEIGECFEVCAGKRTSVW